MNNELKHYGVLGMKWGKRKAGSGLSTRQQIKKAKAKYRKADDDAFSKYEKTIADIEKPYKYGQTLSKKDQVREAKAERDYSNAKNAAKKLYKQTVNAIKSSKSSTKGNKASKVALGIIGTASVATIATAAITRRAAKNFTVLGISQNIRF